MRRIEIFSNAYANPQKSIHSLCHSCTHIQNKRISIWNCTCIQRKQNAQIQQKCNFGNITSMNSVELIILHQWTGNNYGRTSELIKMIKVIQIEKKFSWIFQSLYVFPLSCPIATPFTLVASYFMKKKNTKEII